MRFAKRIVSFWRQARNQSFQGRGGFVELRHFDKHFVKKTSKNLHNYTTSFWMENFEDASGFKCVRVLNMARLYSSTVLNMSEYDSIMPEYASININVLQCAWTWLNIAECPWIYLKMAEQTVLTMPGF